MKILFLVLFIFLFYFKDFETKGGGRGGGGGGGGGARGGGGVRGSGGGVRGGGSRGGSSSGSRSITSGTRNIRSLGSSGSVRTVRTGTAFVYSHVGYSYGKYSGYRFGLSIRRTYAWPVRHVYYGRRYHHKNITHTKIVDPNITPNESNLTDVPTSVVISDIFVKSTQNDNDTLYNCSISLIDFITCFNPDELIDPETHEAWDGGCCQDEYNISMCCIISLTDDKNATNLSDKLFGFYTALICFVLTSFMLLKRLFR